MDKITILILAYNEEHYIFNAVKKLQDCMFRKAPYEVIVCCNGCTDKTPVVAQCFENDNFKIIKTKKGAGVAIRAGIKKATGKYITYVHGDGESDLSFIMKAYRLMKNYDFVTGSRYTKKQTRGASGFRSFLSKGFVWFTNILNPSQLTEVGIIKMFQTSWAQRLKLHSENEDIEAELNYNAFKDKLRIKEIAIKNIILRPASESKAHLLRDGWTLFKSLLKYRIR